MSWETTEALPGSDGGGAFRGGAEPVVAQRVGVTLRERLRLFWYSNPEHPVAHAAERVVVTPGYVYVHRRDGQKLRTPLERLHGERLDRGRVIYGVREGTDLLLPHRDRCDVQVRLSAAVRGAEPVEPWRATHHLKTFAVLGLCGLVASAVLLFAYPLEPTLADIRYGVPMSEMALGTYAALAAAAFGVFALLWGPSRWRIDAVAVTRTRGVVPFLVFSRPPDRFRRVVIRRAWVKPKNQPRRPGGWWVSLELHDAMRLGSWLRLKHIDLEVFTLGSRGEAAVRAEARAFAERLRTLLALEEILERDAPG